MAAGTKIDDLLDELEQEIGDSDLVERVRSALDGAENPNLVRDLRKERDDAVRERDAIRREKQVDVLKAAGLSEKAYDRFLEDWQRDHSGDEFTVDNVKAAAEGVYALTPPNDDGTQATTPESQTGPSDEDRARQAEQDRTRALNSRGTVPEGTPPDPAKVAANLQEAAGKGDKQAVTDLLAANRQQLAKRMQTAS